MKSSVQISRGIESLFGTRDENLQIMEGGLNVGIDLRPDSVQIEGAPRDVARTVTEVEGTVVAGVQVAE